MFFSARGAVAWLGMILAGVALGAYVLVAWPNGATTVKAPSAQPIVRTMASVGELPESELAGVAGAVYPGTLFAYELSPTPLLDAVIAAPERVDAH